MCMYAHACGGRERSTLNAIPQESSTFYIEDGYFIGLGLTY